MGAGSVSSLAGCLRDIGIAPVSETVNSSDGPVGATPTEIHEQPCPPYETTRDSAVCSHTVDTDKAAVYLEPNIEHSTLNNGEPVEDISLVFHNQSTSELTFNPHSWIVWHTVDTEWERVQSELSGDGSLTVSPEETHLWSLAEVLESIQMEPSLEPGLYGLELGVPAPQASNQWIACVALVQFDAAQ